MKQKKMGLEPVYERAPTIHHIRQSTDGSESDVFHKSFAGTELEYTVVIPATPDNRPGEISMQPIQVQQDGQSISSSMFTGVNNRVMRTSSRKKVVINSDSDSKDAFCAVPGCGNRMMSDGNGVDIFPCECGFQICGNCYKDVLDAGNGMCPGCGDAYKGLDESEFVLESQREASNMAGRLSMVKSTEIRSSQNGEFDYTRYLCESKKSYGFGSVVWPADGVGGENGDGDGGDGSQNAPKLLSDKQWKPLSRKVKVPAGILCLYRECYCSL